MSSTLPPQRSDRLCELSTGVWRASAATTRAAADDSPAAIRAATSSATAAPAEGVMRRGEGVGVAWAEMVGFLTDDSYIGRYKLTVAVSKLPPLG